MSNTPHALLIDDEAFNLEVLSRLLATQGVSSTKIQDARLIIGGIPSSTPIDVIFLDLEMPQMDGYQVFSLLRNSLGVDAPIIACTVHANEMSTARDLGFQGFIAKPLDRDRFPDLVRRILDGERVWEF